MRTIALEVLWEDSFPGLFQILEAACILCLHFPSQHWKINFFFHGISLILILLPFSFIYKDSCDYPGPKQSRITSHFKVLNQFCKDPFAFNTHNHTLWRSEYRCFGGSSLCLLQTAQCIICTHSVIHLKSSY